jgi:hypothetical protein
MGTTTWQIDAFVLKAPRLTPCVPQEACVPRADTWGIAVVLDEHAAIDALKNLASTLTSGTSLLRIYWYDGASRKTGPSAEHVRLAGCNDVKIRLGFLNASGQQKGVDSLIVTDLVELARNRSVCDGVLMSVRIHRLARRRKPR